MAAPDTAAYITITDESAPLPNSRTLAVGDGLDLDTGTPGEAVVSFADNLDPGGPLDTGYMTRVAGALNTRNIDDSATVNLLAYPTSVGNNFLLQLNAIDSSTTQNLTVTTAPFAPVTGEALEIVPTDNVIARQEYRPL